MIGAPTLYFESLFTFSFSLVAMKYHIAMIKEPKESEMMEVQNGVAAET